MFMSDTIVDIGILYRKGRDNFHVVTILLESFMKNCQKWDFDRYFFRISYLNLLVSFQGETI